MSSLIMTARRLDTLLKRIVEPSGEEGHPGDSDGFVSGLGPTEHISLPPEGALSGNVIKAGEEAQAILEKAQEEAQALLAEAEAEARSGS